VILKSIILPLLITSEKEKLLLKENFREFISIADDAVNAKASKTPKTCSS